MTYLEFLSGSDASLGLACSPQYLSSTGVAPGSVKLGWRNTRSKSTASGRGRKATFPQLDLLRDKRREGGVTPPGLLHPRAKGLGEGSLVTQEATGGRMLGAKATECRGRPGPKARAQESSSLELPCPDTQTVVSRSRSKPAASQGDYYGWAVPPPKSGRVKGTRSPGAAANRREAVPAPQPIRARPPLRCSLGALPSLPPPTEPKLRSYPRPQPLMESGCRRGTHFLTQGNTLACSPTVPGTWERWDVGPKGSL